VNGLSLLELCTIQVASEKGSPGPWSAVRSGDHDLADTYITDARGFPWGALLRMSDPATGAADAAFIVEAVNLVRRVAADDVRLPPDTLDLIDPFEKAATQGRWTTVVSADDCSSVLGIDGLTSDQVTLAARPFDDDPQLEVDLALIAFACIWTRRQLDAAARRRPPTPPA
jgi:hypothetical protein